MKLYFVRHGETENNIDGVRRGWKQIGLTDNGRKQALEAGKKLRNKGIDLIITSDLRRAIEIAEIIRDEIGEDTPILYDWLIRELYSGDVPDEQIKEILGDNHMIIHTDPESAKQFGSELFSNQTKRTQKFLESLKLLPIKANNIVVVTHGGTLMAAQKGLGLKFFSEPRIVENGEVVEYDTGALWKGAK
ncbi:histidine phosphatase family protein [Candidatus Saccharibacteria bacterium]|nr:histidine phosphatase family protein [Candidatus Saccharibacteria bacterium]